MGSSTAYRRALLAFVCVTCVSAGALADNEGFAINRFEPAERGSDWFTQDSLNIQGDTRFAFGLTGDWAHQPLVMYDADGDEAASIVQDQFFLHLGGSVTFFERLRFGLSIPLNLYQSGETATLDGVTFESNEDPAFGDVRLAADYLVLGKYRSPFSFAAGARVWLPTGSQDAYAGDGAVRVEPRAMVAGDIKPFVYAANLGFNFRAQDQTFAGAEMGSEVLGGASAGVRLLDEKLLLGPELYFSTVVVDGDSFFGRATTPFEILFGGHYDLTREFRVGAGFGPGLSRGVGTPEWRGVLSIDWIQAVEEPKAAPPPPADRDGDGVLDRDDACVDIAGVRTDDPKTNGCPPPGDTDGDGVLDPDDACPTVPGEKTDDPKTNGCPPPDRDKDGILDRDDACVDEPGEKTDDPKTNGCPKPKDTDKDTIMDPEDACPDIPGKQNADPKKNGCPTARVEKTEIRIIERVEFQYNSAKLEASSDRVLNAVLTLINEHPEFTKISVEGHTDDQGNDAYNKNLSRRRAQSVVDWFVKHGVKKQRLSSVGYGEEKPIDSNATEEGRQNNRRVEFHIVEVDGKPATAEGGKP